MEKSSSKSIFNIPGTLVKAQNAQLLVSSGIPALDTILGGGLPVGTVALIEEDLHGTYSNIMLKSFLAEGIINGHSTFVASLDDSPRKIINELPAVIKSDHHKPSLLDTSNLESNSLKIAFRYQNIPMVNDKSESSANYYFDLSKTMSLNNIENADISYWNCLKIENDGYNMFINPAYNELLKSIKHSIKEGCFFLKDNPKKRTILRIGIHSLGSGMWLPPKRQFRLLDASRDLDMFIFCLRALMRSAFAVAVVTIPTHFYHKNSLDRCIHSSDIAMRLQVFSGTELEKNCTLSEYQGFFYLTKLAAINSFLSKHPGTVEYVFKCKRKKFHIEKLHLPPDVQDTSSKKCKVLPSIGCTSINNTLDF